MAVTLGAVKVGAIFDDQEVLIFFKGSAEHTHTQHTHTHKKKGNSEKSISKQHIRKLITLKTQWANNKTPICSAVNKLYSRLQHWWWSKRLQHLYCFHRDSNKPLIKSLSKLQHITESNCAVCWEFVCWQNLVLYIKKGQILQTYMGSGDWAISRNQSIRETWGLTAAEYCCQSCICVLYFLLLGYICVVSVT